MPSVSMLLENLKKCDPEAMQGLWERYAKRIIEYARTQLTETTSRTVDGDDIAASVFESVWKGAQEGRFQAVNSRDELWWLLLAMAKRKAITQNRQQHAQKRGGGVPQFSITDGGPSGPNQETLISQQPTPDELVALGDEFQRLLQEIDDPKTQRIAVLTIQGWTPQEIAKELGVVVATIRRKLRLIRSVAAGLFLDE